MCKKGGWYQLHARIDFLWEVHHRLPLDREVHHRIPLDRNSSSSKVSESDLENGAFFLGDVLPFLRQETTKVTLL